MRTLCLSILALAGACSPRPPLRPVATVPQLMEATVHPASEALFKSVGTVITERGAEDFAPRTEEEWTHVWENAMTLAESGNLLMIGDRARDNGEWMKLSREMIEAGLVAAKAAEARNAQALFDAGGQVYETCERCHEKYPPK